MSCMFSNETHDHPCICCGKSANIKLLDLCHDCARTINSNVVEHKNNNIDCMACHVQGISPINPLLVSNSNNLNTSYVIQPFFPNTCDQCQDNRCDLHACLNIGCETCNRITFTDDEDILKLFKEHYVEWHNRIVNNKSQQAAPAEFDDAYDPADEVECEAYDFDEAAMWRTQSIARASKVSNLHWTKRPM